MTALRARRAVATAVVATAGAAAISVGPVAPVPPAAAADGTDCYDLTDMAMDTQPVTGDNVPYEALQVAAAHDALTGVAPGAGVTVAIVSSGAPLTFIDQEEIVDGSPEPGSPDGSVAAGIIGGPDQGDIPIGIAPGARIVSVKAYDTGYAAADDDSVEPSSASVAAGLGWVRQQLAGPGRKVIAVVPVAVAESAALEQQVRRLERAGVLVVAASGDRPEEGSRSPLERFAIGEDRGPRPGENAAGSAFPADYDSVLSVGVTPAEGAEATSPVRNTSIDVAAPAGLGVSYGPNGEACVLTLPSTMDAAAYVAGVAALVWSGRDGDSAAQLRRRLIRTADGSDLSGATSRLVGAGVVQPLAALERSELPAETAGTGSEVARRAEAPEPAEDVLASTRRNAVWWGLVGGAALVIALLLRPVLARRRGR